MAGGADQDEKTEEPTPKKLEEARKRGDIIHSTEATAFAVLAGMAGLLAYAGPSFARLGQWLMVFLEQAGEISPDSAALQHLAGDAALRIALLLGLVALTLGAGAVFSRYVQDQPTFTATRLKPDLNRLNPFSNAKSTFGSAAVSNLLKALAKLCIVGGAAVWALWPRDATLETLALFEVESFWPLVQQRGGAMMTACVIAFALVAAADYFFTRQAYIKRQRMSPKEIKDELRQSEGDPLIKQRIRQLRYQRARQRMMQAVPNATLVITNPTHYAVALRYVPGETAAPVCVAKGADEVAQRIREVAKAAKVPLVEDPPLARALFAAAEIDQTIPREHYEAVAKVIGFVLRMADQKRSRGAPNRS